MDVVYSSPFINRVTPTCDMDFIFLEECAIPLLFRLEAIVTHISSTEQDKLSGLDISRLKKGLVLNGLALYTR